MSAKAPQPPGRNLCWNLPHAIWLESPVRALKGSSHSLH